jgi:phage repressor protein C with HTH and peptisase S24 domain
MLTHEQIWRAIDRLATTFGYSPSGLAKQAGLDPTSFNKSKRIGPDGKPRWPSTESISRILAATGATMSDFISLVQDVDDLATASYYKIPLIGFAKAGKHGYFNEDGYPQGDSWDEIEFPNTHSTQEGLYALEISGDSMEPLYRKGDILVISPRDKIHVGDRVIVKTADGEVMAKELVKQNNTRIEVKSLNPEHDNIKIPIKDLSWIARILWVSQ